MALGKVIDYRYLIFSTSHVLAQLMNIFHLDLIEFLQIRVGLRRIVRVCSFMRLPATVGSNLKAVICLSQLLFATENRYTNTLSNAHGM